MAKEMAKEMFLSDTKYCKKPEYWTFIKIIAPNDAKSVQSNRSLIAQLMNQKHRIQLINFESKLENRLIFGTAHQHFQLAIGHQREISMSSSNVNKTPWIYYLLCGHRILFRQVKVVDDLLLPIMMDFALSTDGK